MDKLERVQAALAGARVDRPPYSFWTHFPGIDLDPIRLAESTVRFAARHDLDFIKTMPNGMYCVEDWGVVCDYSDIASGGVARIVKPAIARAEDWDRLAVLDVHRGALGRELDHLQRVLAAAGPSIPVLATAFSPMTVASKLSNNLHRAHAAEHAQALTRGLETITQVTCAFAREAIGLGCAGVFFAAQDAAYGVMDEGIYRALGEGPDRRVLEAAKLAGGWFNVVHMHGEDVMFDLLASYDVNAVNWHIGETPPSISEYRRRGGDKPIVGGMQRSNITRRDLAAVRADIELALHETDGRGLLLAPACVIRHPVDDAILDAAIGIIKREGTPSHR
ncbi:MAG: uroporphyrinogen decarboxylase family protein [Casimicrobiaceae bacterium]